ncbi:hypothetical protein TIFTF001_000766 [Ficus carica]|uniref:Uncharacterized protein n=1 Tax=Ficus carica TaxID=3494 RepID=A0AA87Z3I7_FICCA|nr:hypothetical protein TIFTF001_000766 [Ficus carica]
MSMNCLYKVVVLYFFLFLLSSYCNVSTAGRAIPSSAPSTVVQPFVAEVDQDLVSLRPRLNPGKNHFFRGREIKGCLPKGFRHASAPSRFVNYLPLGSAGCSSSRAHSKKP